MTDMTLALSLHAVVNRHVSFELWATLNVANVMRNQDPRVF